MFSRALLVASLLALSGARAFAQPPPNDTVSKTTSSLSGEAMSADPSGRTAPGTTTNATGSKADSGPARDSNGRPKGADNK
jgi:hypothetical protein